jgi:predicted acylesterase/phospholipase RssA
MSSPGAVLAVAALGTFMAFVDATIVNIAIPNIHQEFAGSSLSSVSWVLNAYNIVFAAFLVGGGQLADLLGRRRRVGGVSMGAFIGGQLAMERDVAAIDACCYEEWVRRNPINDYTIPRAGLIRGNKARAMVERVFGDTRAEDLSRSFYCASVNLRRSGLVISREGLLCEIVGASMSLPLIAPPVRNEDALLIDGSLLDNLPLEPMSAAGEGPLVAIDIKGGEERPSAPGEPGRSGARDHRRRLPSLPETLGRIALLSSANTDDAAQRYADLTIPIRVSGVGLLEFHQIDHAREAGRRAALESAPGWLTGAGAAPRDLTGRRTVVRI